MSISTAKRRLFTLIGCIFAWGVMFLVVGFPIFHLHFKVPIATIASYTGICCVLQLALVEWLVYAKKTAHSPDGWAFHRTIAATAFATTIGLLFFYYLRRSRPEDPSMREFTSIAMVGMPILGIIYLTVTLYLLPLRNKTNIVHDDYEKPR